MPAATLPRTARRTARRTRHNVTLAAVIAATGVVATSAGVYAALNATASNTTAQAVGSGTLKLVMAANGGGFTTAISNLAPGDVVKRYVDLTSSGTLDATGITLAVTDGTATKLTTDATNGLKVTVSTCSVAWTLTGTGSCSGTSNTTPVTGTAVASLGTATPGTVVSGAVPASSVYHLLVSVQLPDQNETTVNGTLPTGTIQGLSANLTWTFTEAQRAATTTSS